MKTAFGINFGLLEVLKMDNDDNDDDDDDLMTMMNMMCFLHPNGSQTQFALGREGGNTL